MILLQIVILPAKQKLKARLPFASQVVKFCGIKVQGSRIVSLKKYTSTSRNQYQQSRRVRIR